MKNNIILIGMPGAGKSTVGVVSAKIANKEFQDTDLIIQRETNKQLWKIIEEKGLKNFLHIEEKVILSTIFENCVVATGGSVVYSEKSMEYLKRIGKVIFLDVPLRKLKKRIRNFSTRGIAAPAQMMLKDIFEERLPLYKKYADVSINCAGLTLEQIAEQVAKQD